jgi:hypothetical protein
LNTWKLTNDDDAVNSDDDGGADNDDDSTDDDSDDDGSSDTKDDDAGIIVVAAVVVSDCLFKVLSLPILFDMPSSSLSSLSLPRATDIWLNSSSVLCLTSSDGAFR